MFAGAARGHRLSMRPLKPLDATVEAVEQANWLDPSVQATKKAVDAALVPSPTMRDLLHGVWFGHPLHPALIVVPLGSWVSATVLDLLPGRRDAAQTLTGFGVLAALPTAAAGLADWTDLEARQKRTGLVHAAVNTVALGLQYASWRARRQDRQARGVAYALSALSLSGVSAYLGGHLSYSQAAGANHAEDAPRVLPAEWTRLCALAELPEGKPTRVDLDGVPVFALRRGDRVDALYDLCAHQAGPLSEGELSGSGDDLCISCPWHGSVFRVADGQVRQGPSNYPQPVVQIRVGSDGSVLARSGQDD